jgi:hypothetical protein
MTPKPEISWQKANDEENDVPGPPSRLRTILSRTALAYLSLFLGLGIFLSVLGVNPLTHNGALPKCLLIYVGLALLLALGHIDSSVVDEQTRCWLTVFSHRPYRKR